jgi:microcystin degradation protein MlrC
VAERLKQLIAEYRKCRPIVDIWRRYPDITPGEDAQTDSWACEEVSRSFADFAKRRGWDAVFIYAEDADVPFTDYHAWVQLTQDGVTRAVDWTARQYHNLHQVDGHDPAILDLPWPLVWEPSAPGVHPIVGTFRTVKEQA